MLETEIKTFDELLPEMLKSCVGRVVLVHETEVVGTFDDESSALSEGARLFGLGPFLIRRVLERQPSENAPALMLGILRAIV